MQTADRPMRCQLHCQSQAEQLSYQATVWEPVQDYLHVQETTGTNSLPFFVINFRSQKPTQLLHELPHSQEKTEVLRISIFKCARAEARQRYPDLPPGWLKDEEYLRSHWPPCAMNPSLISHRNRTAALHELARSFGHFIINLKVSILHWNEELL